MTKAQIVKRVAATTGISQYSASMAVNIILENIAVAVEKGEQVTLRGFGVFKQKEVKSFTPNSFGRGRIVIPAHKTVRFIPYKTLVDMVNGRY